VNAVFTTKLPRNSNKPPKPELNGMFIVGRSTFRYEEFSVEHPSINFEALLVNAFSLQVPIQVEQ
jgi:hypothetical protein